MHPRVETGTHAGCEWLLNSTSKAISPRAEICTVAGCGRLSTSRSKAVSLPASPALASYFLAPQEVTKKRCTATPPDLRPGSLRFSLRTAGSELAPFGRSDMRNRNTPFTAAILGGGDGGGAGSSRAVVICDTHPTFGGHPSASMAPRSAGPGGKRGAACLSDRRERVRRVPPGPSIAGNPAQFAGRLRGMSGFAYFCRNKSRSRKPAQPAGETAFDLCSVQGAQATVFSDRRREVRSRRYSEKTALTGA